MLESHTVVIFVVIPSDGLLARVVVDVVVVVVVQPVCTVGLTCSRDVT